MRRRRSRLPLTAAALAALCLHAAAQTAQFDIPAQPLAGALARFAQQTGAQLVYPPGLAQGRHASAVHGSLDAEAALRQLLRGSGLEARRDGATWTLVPAPARAETALGEVKVVAQAERSATTEGSGSYAARGATLFKDVQSLKDIPQSITVVTRQQMDDQRLDTLDDVFENTPGIQLVKRYGGGSDIMSRGFTQSNVQYDGVPIVRAGAYGNNFIAGTFDLDRVEILRGAQGLLEGAGNPGGSVNLVRKRGLADRQIKVEGRAGSWGTYGAQLDAGGALNEDRKVRSRVVLDYERTGSFLDTVSDRNLNIYGALDFDLSSETAIGLALRHSHLNGNSSQYDGIPSYTDGRPVGVPRSTYANADWSYGKRKETQLMGDLERRFSSDWKLKIAGSYIKEDWDAAVSQPNGLVSLVNGSVGGLGYSYDFDVKTYGIDASLSGKFKAAGTEHELVFGGNYSRQKRDDAYAQYRNHWAYNILNIDRNVPLLSNSIPNRRATLETSILSKGIYGALRSKLTTHLTSIVGLRVSNYDYQTVQVFTPGATTLTSKKASKKVTPYAGLIYTLTPQWSAYASYAGIFQPQNATDAQFKVLKPILGSNYEIGIKGNFFGGTLNTSLAFFRIDQKNRAVTDYDAPQICGNSGSSYCSVAAGKVRSEGVEVEGHGSLTKNWQISGGYTYVRNKYLENIEDPSLVGKQFDYETPKHMLRLWSNWKLPGTLNAWQVGVGVKYRSEMRTDSTTQLNPMQGGYSVWDARVAYQINPKWQLALNIGNVFDKRYYSYMRTIYYANYAGEPRNFLLTLRGSF